LLSLSLSLCLSLYFVSGVYLRPPESFFSSLLDADEGLWLSEAERANGGVEEASNAGERKAGEAKGADFEPTVVLLTAADDDDDVVVVVAAAAVVRGRLCYLG
jgi:hypothetical protein